MAVRLYVLINSYYQYFVKEQKSTKYTNKKVLLSSYSK